MPWKIERLSGTIDGSNRAFTISQNAIHETLLVVFAGVPLEAVNSQPEIMQAAYVQSGMNVTLGLAPVVGQNPWCRYFYE